jgi:hypothetical protein
MAAYILLDNATVVQNSTNGFAVISSVFTGIILALAGAAFIFFCVWGSARCCCYAYDNVIDDIAERQSKLQTVIIADESEEPEGEN